MRAAVQILREEDPKSEVEAEMHGDVLLDETLRQHVFPSSHLTGQANGLVTPNLDAANIALQLSKFSADALSVGPILIGPAASGHILTLSVTARGVVAMTALSFVEAQQRTLDDAT